MTWKMRNVNVHEDELQVQNLIMKVLMVLKNNNNNDYDDNGDDGDDDDDDDDDDNGDGGEDDDDNDGDVRVSSVLCVTKSTAAGGMHLLQRRYVQLLLSSNTNHYTNIIKKNNCYNKGSFKCFVKKYKFKFERFWCKIYDNLNTNNKNTITMGIFEISQLRSNCQNFISNVQ